MGARRDLVCASASWGRGPSITRRPNSSPRSLRAWVIVVAAGCAAVVAFLVVGALTSGERAAVDELPSVAEVVAAEAHDHGVRGPEEPAPTAVPSSASTLSAYDQIRRQLQAVAATDGVPAALAILEEIARTSPEAASRCDDVYDELAASAGPDEIPARSTVCPAVGVRPSS